MSEQTKYRNLGTPDNRVGARPWIVTKDNPWSRVVPATIVDGQYNFVILPAQLLQDTHGILVIGNLPLGVGSDDMYGHPVLARSARRVLGIEQHSHGEDVTLAAGDFAIEDGKIIEIRASSGHYQTDAQSLRVAHETFDEYDAPLSRRCRLIPFPQTGQRRFFR